MTWRDTTATRQRESSLWAGGSPGSGLGSGAVGHSSHCIRVRGKWVRRGERPTRDSHRYTQVARRRCGESGIFPWDRGAERVQEGKSSECKHQLVFFLTGMKGKQTKSPPARARLTGFSQQRRTGTSTGSTPLQPLCSGCSGCSHVAMTGRERKPILAVI